MTSDQIAGIARAGLAAIGGVVVAHGFADEQTVAVIVGAVTTIVVAIWSVWAKTSK